MLAYWVEESPGDPGPERVSAADFAAGDPGRLAESCVMPWPTFPPAT